MGLLSALGINLPGVLGGNPFSGLTGQGGLPTPPSIVGQGFQSLIPMLAQAFQGKLGDPAAPQGVPQVQASGPSATSREPAGFQAQGQANPRGVGGYNQTDQAPAGGSTYTPDPQSVRPPAMFIPPPAQPGPQPQSAPPPQGPPGWAPIRAGIFKGESGGDPNTLYGHIEQKGSFAGTKLTDMTVDQALAFSAPDGPYGRWAKANGISAAPMGSYQVIHSTLRDLVKPGMGLTGSERMTPDMQEKMGQFIYSKQGTGAWAGYHGPADPAKYPGVSGGFSAPSVSPTYDAMSRPSGQGASAPTGMLPNGGIPGTSTGGPDLYGAGASNGDFNSKLATDAAGAGGKTHHGKAGGSSGASDPGSSGGGSHRNSVSADYRRYQARKGTDYLRSLSPVATIQSLENIGKAIHTGKTGAA